MHPKAVAAIVESVRRRVAQGDCPTEPAQSVETLEDAILQLAAEQFAAPASGAEPEITTEMISAGCKAVANARILRWGPAKAAEISEHQRDEMAAAWADDVRVILGAALAVRQLPASWTREVGALNYLADTALHGRKQGEG